MLMAPELLDCRGRRDEGDLEVFETAPRPSNRPTGRKDHVHCCFFLLLYKKKKEKRDQKD
jgi:hypothetical protein